MFSAMPALAVRRERKKSKSSRGGAPPSHHSSITSLSRSRGFLRTKRSKTQSISTISSMPPNGLRRPGDSLQSDKRKLRFLMYVGTVLMVAGLILVFIGVGANVSGTQTVGLLFIGAGSLFCLVKVFCTKPQTVFLKKSNAQSEPGVFQLPSSVVSTPASEVNDFAGVHRLPLATTDETTEGITNDESNQTISPTSTNSVPETQVLIPDDKERY